MDSASYLTREYFFKIEGSDHKVEVKQSAITWCSDDTKRKVVKSNRVAFSDILRIQAFPEAKAGVKSQVASPASALIIDYVIRNGVVDPSSSIATVPWGKPSPNYVWKVLRVIMFCPATNFEQCQQIAGIVQAHIANHEKQRPKKLLVIINPSGGRKKGVSVYEKTVRPLFDLAGITTEVIVSKYTGHAKEILQTYDLDSIDGLVSVGGDGTLAQIVNGLVHRVAADRGLDLDNAATEMDQLPKRIGIIPSGTGNGAILMSTGTNDPVTAALHIVVGTSCDVNLMSVHNGPRLVSWGVLLSCYGMLGDAVFDSENNRNLGIFRYMYGIGRNLMKLHTNRLTVQMKLLRSDEGDASAAVSEWQEMEGNFIMVDNFLMDLFAPGDFRDPVVNSSVTWQHGGLYLTSVDDRLGRMKLIKLMKQMTSRKMEKPTKVEGVTMNTCEEYKLILTESSGFSAKRKSKSAASKSDFMSVINVDGDPFILYHPEVHVRLRRHMLKVFGTCLSHDMDREASEFRRLKSIKAAK